MWENAEKHWKLASVSTKQASFEEKSFIRIIEFHTCVNLPKFIWS